MNARDRMTPEEFEEHLRQLAGLPPEEKLRRMKALDSTGGRPVKYGRGVFERGRPPTMEWADDYPVQPSAGSTPPSTRALRTKRRNG